MNHSNYLLLPFVLALAGCGGGGEPAADDHAAHPAPTGLSAQARANFGLRIERAKTSSFKVYESLPAVAVMKPLQVQPVTAPLGGRVQSVNTQPGAKAEAGQVLLRLVRDALPRVTLTLTEDLLKPASEEFHETVVSLRKAVEELAIASSELKRLSAFGGEDETEAPLIPKQRIIDLRYAEVRARKDVDLLEGRLKLHGLGEQDLAAIRKGEPVQPGDQRWKVSLVANGLWNKDCDLLVDALPPGVRNLPWTFAGIGELHAAGLLDPGLASWLRSEPKAGAAFIEMAGLMQQGASLEAIRDLYEAGAFEAVIEVRAPGHAPSWDVREVQVRPGERIAAGAVLLTLTDQRELYLEARPAGREVSLLRQAVLAGVAINARPLIAGSGPDLEALAVERMQPGDDGDLRAWLPAPNIVLKDEKGFRSWALQPGTRYVLEVPVRSLEKVWVFPAGALTEDGADYVVFVENGEAFEKRKVELLFRDEKQVVLGKRSDLFPGDAVVAEGAFAVSLALQASSGGAIDPHAGHSH